MPSDDIFAPYRLSDRNGFGFTFLISKFLRASEIKSEHRTKSSVLGGTNPHMRETLTAAYENVVSGMPTPILECLDF